MLRLLASLLAILRRRRSPSRELDGLGAAAVRSVGRPPCGPGRARPFHSSAVSGRRRLRGSRLSGRFREVRTRLPPETASCTLAGSRGASRLPRCRRSLRSLAPSRTTAARRRSARWRATSRPTSASMCTEPTATAAAVERRRASSRALDAQARRSWSRRSSEIGGEPRRQRTGRRSRPSALLEQRRCRRALAPGRGSERRRAPRWRRGDAAARPAPHLPVRRLPDRSAAPAAARAARTYHAPPTVAEARPPPTWPTSAGWLARRGRAARGGSPATA